MIVISRLTYENTLNYQEETHMLSQENYQSFVLQLFGLENEDVQSVRYIHAGQDAIVDITLNSHPIPCPECGYPEPKIYNYVLKKIKHSELSDRACTLHYHARRYICPICRKTYYEHNPFVFKNMKISAKTVYNILNDLRDSSATFSNVAHRYHVSPSSVSSIFDNHVDIERKKLPKRINIDETYAFKSKISKYVCVLLDFDTQKPIDILPSRRYDYLLSYFMQIPREERLNVELVCSDMYDCYRSITKACFPNAKCIVDHYHVSQDLNRWLDRVRIRVMKNARYHHDKDAYYLLKKFNWMIYKSEESKEDIRKLKKKGKLPLFDPNMKRKKNMHFNKFLNYYEIRDMIWNIDPELKEAWALKDDVVEFYNTCTVENAQENLDVLIELFKNSSVYEMKEFYKTLKKWKTEIVNSFYIVGYEYRVEPEAGRVVARDMKMNNAIIENRNSIIKIIKKNANGYTNWTRFRNRLLYVLDKDSTYSMYPIKKEEKQ